MTTQLFYSVTIPVNLWFIGHNKKQTGKTLFIDARNMGHMVDRKHRDFTEDDIAKQDYILTPGRYVGIKEKEEDDEPFDEKMNLFTTELGGMFAKSHQLEEEIKKNLEGIGWKI